MGINFDGEKRCNYLKEGYYSQFNSDQGNPLNLNVVTNENNNLLLELAFDNGDVGSIEMNVVGNTLTASSSDDEITTYTKTAVEYSSHNCN